MDTHDLTDLVLRVQQAFPQVYFACHVEHAGTHTGGMRERESRLLGHLSLATAVGMRGLAKHLAISMSTMSELVDVVEVKGWVRRVRDSADRRRVLLILTEEGARVRSQGSVLDFDRLTAVLRHIPEAQRAAAVQGLEQLADASNAFMEGPP